VIPCERQLVQYPTATAGFRRSDLLAERRQHAKIARDAKPDRATVRIRGQPDCASDGYRSQQGMINPETITEAADWVLYDQRLQCA
jgi:hypothetical protein